MPVLRYTVQSDQAKTELQKIKQLEGARRGIQAAGLYTLGKVRWYPVQKKVKMQFVSEKQRRWFFAALREGLINIPYVRTYNLRNSWEVTYSSIRAVLTNKAKYAHWVMGEGTQTSMMKQIGWLTDKFILNRESPRIIQIISESIEKALK